MWISEKAGSDGKFRRRPHLSREPSTKLLPRRTVGIICLYLYSPRAHLRVLSIRNSITTNHKRTSIRIWLVEQDILYVYRYDSQGGVYCIYLPCWCLCYLPYLDSWPAIRAPNMTDTGCTSLELYLSWRYKIDNHTCKILWLSRTSFRHHCLLVQAWLGYQIVRVNKHS